jgi:hypothetical protein
MARANRHKCGCKKAHANGVATEGNNRPQRGLWEAWRVVLLNPAQTSRAMDRRLCRSMVSSIFPNLGNENAI